MHTRVPTNKALVVSWCLVYTYAWFGNIPIACTYSIFALTSNLCYSTEQSSHAPGVNVGFSACLLYFN